MSTSITTVFGTEIQVSPGPQIINKRYDAYAGASGSTEMLLSQAGRIITITGTLRTSGATWAIARANMITLFGAIDAYRTAAADEWTYNTESYSPATLNLFKPLPLDKYGNLISSVNGTALAVFIATLRQLNV